MDAGTDPLNHLDVANEAIADLRTVLAEERHLEALLEHNVSFAAQLIVEADAVSITSLTSMGPRTVAATDPAIAALDGKQYAADRGPCLDAARDRLPVRAVIAERRREWPEFSEAADAVGICTSVSVPLLLDDPGNPGEGRLVGALNVYSRSTKAFDPLDETLLRLFTTAATAVIDCAGRWYEARRTITQLEQAMATRAGIEQAKGALMAIHGCTGDEAFARLVEQSQHRNVKLHQVAQDFLTTLRAPG
ncbi:ANTAR domain-containing response regulator [Amycolatopsis sp. NPDC059021]|uniref:ANTAR domain-containing response regulator n=1 Tax=Amycolatopsis sp. NPDC059021 TaxID=3346704 RepID=UPI00366F6716